MIFFSGHGKVTSARYPENYNYISLEPVLLLITINPYGMPPQKKDRSLSFTKNIQAVMGSTYQVLPLTHFEVVIQIDCK